MHISLSHAIHQVWPTNPSGTFAFDNYVHIVKDYYFIPPGVKGLQLQGYCVNADNDHKIQWAFSINRPEEIFPTLFGPIKELEQLTEMYRQMGWIQPEETEAETIG